jgi:hypothetical protein
VETDLSTGVLVSVFVEKNAQLGYYLLYQKGLRQEAKIFVNWILSSTHLA